MDDLEITESVNLNHPCCCDGSCGSKHCHFPMRSLNTPRSKEGPYRFHNYSAILMMRLSAPSQQMWSSGATMVYKACARGRS